MPAEHIFTLPEDEELQEKLKSRWEQQQQDWKQYIVQNPEVPAVSLLSFHIDYLLTRLFDKKEISTRDVSIEMQAEVGHMNPMQLRIFEFACILLRYWFKTGNIEYSNSSTRFK